MKKSVISTAVITALGIGVSMSVSAAPVAITGMSIEDVGSNSKGTGGYLSALDGNAGAFAFAGSLISVKSDTGYGGTNSFTTDVVSGALLGGNVGNATGSFTTGFLFAGQPFIPFTMDYTGVGGPNNFAGTIDTTTDALAVSDLGFGGQFSGGSDFQLNPDAGYPLDILWAVPRGNGEDWDYAMRWGHDITSAEDPSGNFTASTAQWVLEGCLTTNVSGKCAETAIPVPAAVWLFGSGLVGLAGVARRRKTKKA